MKLLGLRYKFYLKSYVVNIRHYNVDTDKICVKPPLLSL